MENHHISSEYLDIIRIKELVDHNISIDLSGESVNLINRCRSYLEKRIEKEVAPIYGVTTGFGSLYNRSISREQLKELQKNLVMSHACGTGAKVPPAIVKLMLLLKVQSLSYGYSGVRRQTIDRLIQFYNNNVLPVIFEQGSLGASGDLAPLAHLSLPLLGLGEVYYKDAKRPAVEVLHELSWEPIELEAKEGLALLNGTQFMSAYGVHCLLRAKRILELADLIAAISLEGFDGRLDPFNELVHKVRPHKGQIETAKNISSILDGSDLVKRNKEHVQDPYSIRCTPQVHGATRDAMDYVESVIMTEVNSVTDNPTVFPNEDKVISAGNFHGQPLALALDHMALALSEIGSISERRTYLLVSGQRGLPPFLVANPGINSGFMIPQYTAASIASQNKQLCTPASADSIISSNGQEDHVSMGANAATKALRVVENVETILAIELFAAAQALEFRRPGKSSPEIEKFIQDYRDVVKFVENDRSLYKDIDKSLSFLRNLTEKVE